jgi:hypothetical protein
MITKLQYYTAVWDGSSWLQLPGITPKFKVSRFWDGEQYTAVWDGSSWIQLPGITPKFRRSRFWPDPPERSIWRFPRTTIMGLVMAGFAVLAWGASRMDEQPCEVGPHTYTDGSGLWLPWLILVVLAAVGYHVGRENGTAWVRTMAVLGIVAAGVTFPVWAVVLSGMNCSL